MSSRRPAAGAAALALLAASAALVEGRPNRYGHSDREERHMFPATTTGPMDPAWSRDGRWIAFSMRGDVWKVPAEGGEAIALTSGPDYHFEPAWSPDGRRIALSYDRDGDLGVGVVDADGGPVRMVAPSPDVDVQPAWGADGRALYFVSARGDGWRVYRQDLTVVGDTAIQVAPGIQPAISPDGGRLAYVSRGSLYVMELPGGAPRLVRAEESAYRTKPAWTPDGSALLYVSDEEGTNDVRIVPATGGSPIRLTADDLHDEYAPAPSPDGSRFAFVSNRNGPTALHTIDLAGGRPNAWREVDLTARRAARPIGRIRVRVLGSDGRPIPARVHVDASDGRSYSPDGAFHRAMMVHDRHYFHTTGEAEIAVPAGEVRVEALRGFEYRPAEAAVDVAANGVGTATLRLERMADLPSGGWYSGDTHLHDRHQGRYGLTHEAFQLQLLAEDVHVGFPLIHMDGTRLMGRWEDLTGRPHPLSTEGYVFQYAQEFRGGLGHVALLGVREFVLPFTAGAPGTPYAQHALDLAYLDAAREQGGMGGFVHPYARRPGTPAEAATTLIAVDVALGRGDYYDLAALWSDELGSAEFYYRLLNAGFRLPATGGTDNFSDVWRDPPVGAGRTYARIDGELSVEGWLDAVRRGRTFATTGPLLFLDVDGREPGDEIRLTSGPRTVVPVRAHATSIAPLDSLQIVVNGEVVRTVPANERGRVEFDGDLEVPHGGWIAARVLGPPSPYLGDDYAFAQSSPVYVVREGSPPFIARADVEFLLATVDAIGDRVEGARWRTGAERRRFLGTLDEARTVYRRLLARAEE